MKSTKRLGKKEKHKGTCIYLGACKTKMCIMRVNVDIILQTVIAFFLQRPTTSGTLAATRRPGRRHRRPSTTRTPGTIPKVSCVVHFNCSIFFNELINFNKINKGASIGTYSY